MIKSEYAEFIHRKMPSVDVDNTVRHFVPVLLGVDAPRIDINYFVSFIQKKIQLRADVMERFKTRTKEREIAGS